jgi:hypothetical protein
MYGFCSILEKGKNQKFETLVIAPDPAVTARVRPKTIRLFYAAMS